MKVRPLFLNGQFEAASGEATIEVVDPSNKKVMALAADGNADDVDRAVAAARSAFDGEWPAASPRERGRVLTRLANAIRERAGELAELETTNCGKPIVEAECEMDDAATCFEY